MNKIIGIIGGAGPLASALLYQKIVEKDYQERPQSPQIPIIIINYPFATPMFSDSKKICSSLEWCIDRFIESKVTLATIACNTLHIYLPNIDRKGISFIPLPSVTETYVKRMQCKKVLLLATNATINSKLYNDSEIEYFYLAIEKQRLLTEIIQRLLLGKILKSDGDMIIQLINEVSLNKKVDGVILGCTELSVLHNRYSLSVFNGPLIIDSTNILAHEIVKEY